LDSFVLKNKEKWVLLLHTPNKAGWLPIYFWFAHKSLPLLECLSKIDKLHLKHSCKNGSVLIKACEVTYAEESDDNLQIIKYLIEKCKLNINQTDQEGWSPLYMAWFKSNYQVVKYLLENGAESGVVCTNGSTPLHIWAERGFADILKILWAKRADLVYSQDEEGNTPLHIASLWSHMEILEFLWEEGGKKLVEIKNKEGLTAIDLAYEENQIYAHEFLCEKMGIKANSTCSIL
jgi:ankyrin repeat protein